MSKISSARRNNARPPAEVLRYRPKKLHQSTVVAAYRRFCLQHCIPYRCASADCQLHTENPKWRDKPIRLILDHKNGNSCDNDPKNLQWVCPNCNTQLATFAGRNRGRVKWNDVGGYVLRNDDGSEEYRLKAEVGEATAIGVKATIMLSSA